MDIEKHHSCKYSVAMIMTNSMMLMAMNYRMALFVKHIYRFGFQLCLFDYPQDQSLLGYLQHFLEQEFKIQIIRQFRSVGGSKIKIRPPIFKKILTFLNEIALGIYHSALRFVFSVVELATPGLKKPRQIVLQFGIYS